jgi:hypothetical protein
MQLRHISPRSSDWMDAMDEGGGGRGWEKLAPEERIKLRRDSQARVVNGRNADHGFEALDEAFDEALDASSLSR